MVVGFTTACAIGAYHHQRCEFESCSVEVYLIQHYVIRFVSDVAEVGGFLRVLWFPPPITLTCHDITEILLIVTSNTVTLTPYPIYMF